MKKKISILSLMLGILVMLASCAQDEMADAGGDLRPVTITANIDPQMTTRANGTDSELPTRCYVEVHNLDGEQVFFDEMTPANGQFTTTATLGDGVKYNFYFWADNAKGAAAPTSLGNIAYTENTVAYSGMVQEGEWSANGISCTLKHCVAKITLRTTADVPAGRNTIMQIGGGCFNGFNLLEGMVNEGKTAGSVTGYGDIYQISTNSAFSAGDDVLTCYVLAATKTEEESVEDHEHGNCDYTVYLLQDIPEYELLPRYATEVRRVPIKPNQHTIIKGDVSKVSHKDFAYTVTTESLGGTSAGYDETWGSTIPDLPFEKLDLTKGAINITEDGTYHITSNGTTTANAITVTGNISPKIYISDLKIGTNSGSAISITDGANATIHVVGTGNSVSSGNNTGMAISGGGTVIIEGSSTADVLTAKGGSSGSNSSGTAGAGIGSPIGGTQGGNIIIRNVTVHATGGGKNEVGGAGIGSSTNAPCGDITIENAVIIATGGSAAAGIGMGCNNYDYKSPAASIGKITIVNSDVSATGGNFAAAIGFSFSEPLVGSGIYRTGQISITTEDVSGFLSKLKTVSKYGTAPQRIGKGSYMVTPTFLNTNGSAAWEGVVINGTAYPGGYE